MVNEDFLQFVWKKGLFRRDQLRTTGGIRVEILEAGAQNFHAGPDFFNARIKMGPLEWAGNVEIHLRASDWIRHGHHLDPAYDNVILHVVLDPDTETLNSKGRPIQTLLLDLHDGATSKLQSLRSNQEGPPCNPYLGSIPDALWRQWYSRLQAERFKVKAGRIRMIMQQQGMHPEKAIYIAMAHGFGLPINSLPFEQVASLIPLQLLSDHRERIQHLEALLFGTSGFLQGGQIPGSYPARLAKLYSEMGGILPGRSLPLHLWKFLRLRPASFPTLRLSQFASLLHHHLPLAGSLFPLHSIAAIEQFFRVRASEYWDTHYVFGKCSPCSVKCLGRQSILTIIINVIVPFLMAMGRMEQRSAYFDQAREILFDLEAESNQILKKWINFGIKPSNAFESQALIQLYNGYCLQKRCLDCQIGAFILESGFHEEQ